MLWATGFGTDLILDKGLSDMAVADQTEPLLSVRGLRVAFPTKRGIVEAVSGVSFDLGRGEVLGIVGESGCGKSTLCAALTRMLPAGASLDGAIVFRGEDLLAKSEREMREIRGRHVTTVLQNPMTAMDPLYTVGSQLDELLAHNTDVPRSARRARAVDLLRSVSIPSPEDRLASYPHQMSGGMKQRTLIAAATAPGPELLLADEPTTALDVTVQEQILSLLARIRRHQRTSIILVTHDLGIVRRITDRVLVMYAGQVVEAGPTEAVFSDPQHPYSQALVASIPRIGRTGTRLVSIEGSVPDLARLPAGCRFAPRCRHAHEACRVEPPPVSVRAGGTARCWLKQEGLT
jgi:oligopeptide/dipeptide ABC transporter ATP-binding protein